MYTVYSIDCEHWFIELVEKKKQKKNDMTSRLVFVDILYDQEAYQWRWQEYQQIKVQLYIHP